MAVLEFHTVNVGKGSCHVIKHSTGNLTMIDIDDSLIPSDDAKAMLDFAKRLDVYHEVLGLLVEGHRLLAVQRLEAAKKVELTDPIAYIDEKFPAQDIFRFILTHPDMDHMSGLSRLVEQRDLLNFWDTENEKVVEGGKIQAPYRQEDWDKYQELRVKEDSPKVLRLTTGATGDYWTDDGLIIVSPDKYLVDLANDTKEYNHLSYVLRIEYQGKSILACGDATSKAQQHLVDTDPELLSADVLIAPHHGSKSDFNQDFFDAVDPKCVIVSVARGVDYAYDRYSAGGARVFSTKHFGNIVVRISNDGTLDVETERA